MASGGRGTQTAFTVGAFMGKAIQTSSWSMVLHKIITKSIPPILYGGMSGCDLAFKGDVTSIKILELFPQEIWARDSNWKQWFIPPMEIVTREHSQGIVLSHETPQKSMKWNVKCMHVCGPQRSPSCAPLEWFVLFCETGSFISVEFINLARLPIQGFFFWPTNHLPNHDTDLQLWMLSLA